MINRSGSVITDVITLNQKREKSIVVYTDLSLTARLAVGLRCFADYCVVRELTHPEVDALLDDLWELPPAIASPEGFTSWENGHPHLINVGLGDPFSDEFQYALHNVQITPREFRHIIESLMEIVFSSFYGASEDQQSIEFLRNVIAAVTDFDVIPPRPDLFNASLFADNNGWGKPLSSTERDRWRFAAT